MPLAFESLSHGSIAFGFFNIESDMLLLENHFFFADVFCDVISEFAENSDMTRLKNYSLQGYVIEQQDDIGDLMGAIHGIRHTGFIGDIYRLFPFPRRPEAFKQSPEGFKNQARVTTVISTYGIDTNIAFGSTEELNIRIGRYLFDRLSFQALINYVWKGGYPRWKDDMRPDYLLDMRSKIDQSRNLFFNEISFR